MVTVSFRDTERSTVKHCWNDWGLVVEKGGYSIGEPEPQTYTVQIPGRNGLLDLTEALTGDVRYNNREISVSLSAPYVPGTFESTAEAVRGFLHGQRRLLTFNFNPDFAFVGRCVVAAAHGDGLGTITVTMDAEPYQQALTAYVSKTVEWTNATTGSKSTTAYLGSKSYVLEIKNSGLATGTITVGEEVIGFNPLSGGRIDTYGLHFSGSQTITVTTSMIVLKPTFWFRFYEVKL